MRLKGKTRVSIWRDQNLKEYEDWGWTKCINYGRDEIMHELRVVEG